MPWSETLFTPWNLGAASGGLVLGLALVFLLVTSRRQIGAALVQVARRLFSPLGFFSVVIVVFLIISVLSSGEFFNINITHGAVFGLLGYALALGFDLVSVVCSYLELRVQAAKSPWTLSTERSALRFCCQDRHLAERVELPERKREKIKKLRHPVAKDTKFQPAHWQLLLKFEKAVGLRKNELRRILVKEIRQVGEELVADVSRGKGGKKREVAVLPGREQDVLAVVSDRNPNERIFPRLPDTEVQDLRRDYAQKLYLHSAGPGWTLPPTDRRLSPTDYNREAVERVSKALGHNRRDVVLNNYLR